ncbi:2-(3-amino-3-carboxypropyl)histidine synthase subunit [Oceanobacillus profundus]|uniref:2-(3-amino-3-carboxypropyl)histidine synthase n=1 Tax=Oceanobacillus profundus TaxID=372463 RepID=UPI0011E05BDC|nr:2-(3-amino-3-carboxypropyl)histidine synthase [Oceanobacillus profundus]MCM3399840.1 2-(3-amino-3-carboxypropyl)histidine synthase subunit [Oceanobacillus profundus]
MKSQVLNGLEQAKDTSYVHALQEVAAITYLIGTDRLFNGQILGCTFGSKNNN